jgi:hypothetical protein
MPDLAGVKSKNKVIWPKPMSLCVARKLKIGRRVDGQNEEKILMAEMKRGWKMSPKLTFNGEADNKA